MLLQAILHHRGEGRHSSTREHLYGILLHYLQYANDLSPNSSSSSSSSSQIDWGYGNSQENKRSISNRTLEALERKGDQFLKVI